jgi:hypothetical protein
MTQFVIVPMGGVGSRFVNANYKTFKPFLKVSNTERIIDNIINNFPINFKIIIIGNKKKTDFIKKNLKKSIIYIEIKNHKKGPLFSIFLAKEKIKAIINNNKFYVVYSDINWKWNFQVIKKSILKTNITIFTHNGFHPHLEINPKSDFCIENSKTIINKVSEKKIFGKDYKKNLLAVGCYYFNEFSYFMYYFEKNFILLKNLKKELYIINLIEFLIKNQIKINHYKIDKFVHLGDPVQYENFLAWRKILDFDFEKYYKLSGSNVMLMSGKGERVKKLNEKKPLLKIKNFFIYDYIFKKIGTKKKYIITNNKYYKFLDKKYKIIKIKKTKSMIETLEKTLTFFPNIKNFFISSCDCFGLFDTNMFNNIIKNNKIDIVLFAFDISQLQNSVKNSHTELLLNKNKIVSINPKTNDINSKFGQAGFYWVRHVSIFSEINKFKKSYHKERELILDDYFRYLLKCQKYNFRYVKLDSYVHLGTVNEYKEMKYWENYFSENK